MSDAMVLEKKKEIGELLSHLEVVAKQLEGEFAEFAGCLSGVLREGAPVEVAEKEPEPVTPVGLCLRIVGNRLESLLGAVRDVKRRLEL